MKQSFLFLAVVTALVTGFVSPVNSQSSNPVFQSLIKRYEQSINKADTALGAELWSKSDAVSFINPRSTAYGWYGIKNIYKMFSDNFPDRKLHGFGEKVTVYDDVAWFTFEWIFDAAFKKNSQKIQAKGRETQIWHKEKDIWKLVPVHYSNLPVSGEGIGF